MSMWRKIEINSDGLVKFTGENRDGSILTKNLTIDGFYQLDKILYGNKKTFVCGLVSTGKTLIMKYILRKLKQEISPVFILSKNNEELTEEISQYSLSKIIELNEHSVRNTVIANENEYNEVIPSALDIKDHNFIVQDDLFKYSETINNLFENNNKINGYLTTVHIGRFTMLGFARNEVEEAVIYLNKILQKNNKTFLDEPIVLIVTEKSDTIKHGKIVAKYSLKVFNNIELNDINKKIPDEYRNISYSMTESAAQLATKNYLTELQKPADMALRKIEELNILNPVKALYELNDYTENFLKTRKS